MRRVLLVTHAGREAAVRVASQLSAELTQAGIDVCVPANEFTEMQSLDNHQTDGLAARTVEETTVGAELVVVVGGDGTILRAAEAAYADDIPLLGLNLGHVGFLAEVESDEVRSVARAVIDRSYLVEERVALDVQVVREGSVFWRTFALNEAAISKQEPQLMVDVLLEVEGRPLSRWGCDGVVVATPTGSTAYNWSVGGPVVWPEVRAIVVSPISAHALFARSLVVDPTDQVAVYMMEHSANGVIWCDGQRHTELFAGDQVVTTSASQPVRFARLHDSAFTDRLVAKFQLPIEGWRGHDH